MRSSGFGLGKKQSRGDEPKRQPPTGTDVTQLLASSQKNPDKPFTLSWQMPNESGTYVLSVINFHGASKDRRGWNSSAIDNSGVGVAEWKLHKDIEGKRTELFNMQTSDAYLIHSVIEEALAGGAPASGGSTDAYGMGAQSAAQEAAAPVAAAPTTSASSSAGDLPAEGNLRATPIRNLIEKYHSAKATGRLIVDIGTVTAEVFFAEGQPVHAKSCNSIYADRDATGDSVVIDLLTWDHGDFKFQNGWPAASRSVNSSLDAFLTGTASATPAPAPAAAIPQSSSKAAAPKPSTASNINPDDFANADDLIGETFSNLIEPSGLLKYGMFLMLTKTEFARYDASQGGFCIATIGLEGSSKLTEDALQKLLECFEGASNPLDILAYCTPSRLYALFPHSTSATVGTTLKHFINNIQSTELDKGVHGNTVRISIGLAEVPRDGVDFDLVMPQLCNLRRAATPDRPIVASR